MMAISLWQPWASAIAVGVKRIETRHWSTNHRGPIAIHAAGKRSAELKEFFEAMMHSGSEFYYPFREARLYGFAALPLGALVATANLVDVVPTQDVAATISNTERALGDYTPGRYAWILGNVKALPQPYFIKGHQGFFDVPDYATAL